MTKHNHKKGTEFLSAEAFSSWAPFPSAQTMFRAHLLDPQTEELIAQATAKISPEIWERDREHAERIERAPTVEALLDLIPVASGTAEPAWHRRMRQFGPEVVPVVEAQLRRVRDIKDDHLRGLSYEHLLSALRWKGEAGAAALLNCFDDLNGYMARAWPAPRWGSWTHRRPPTSSGPFTRAQKTACARPISSARCGV
ncbi:MAG TPA: hypothetical protein VMY40_05325 [Anaerolineae bacterium]|nr:hypothetical protein [Anaerolineae bacterium]